MADCAICLQQMCQLPQTLNEDQAAAEPLATLPCGHTFHSMCVLRAYMHSPHCPLCRGSEIVIPPDETTTISEEASDDANGGVDTGAISLLFNVENISDADAQRRSRNYARRVRHISYSDARAIYLRGRCREAELARRVSKAAYDNVVHAQRQELNRLLRSDPEVSEARRTHQRALRSHVRYNRMHREYVTHLVGTAPPTLLELRRRRREVDTQVARIVNDALRGILTRH